MEIGGHKTKDITDSSTHGHLFTAVSTSPQKKKSQVVIIDTTPCWHFEVEGIAFVKRYVRDISIFPRANGEGMEIPRLSDASSAQELETSPAEINHSERGPSTLEDTRSIHPASSTSLFSHKLSKVLCINSLNSLILRSG